MVCKSWELRALDGIIKEMECTSYQVLYPTKHQKLAITDKAKYAMTMVIT